MFLQNFQSRIQLWLDCANKLTAVIQNVIEFAKLVPGFMKLQQDDQIMLLKGGIYSSYPTKPGVLLLLYKLPHLCHVT